ncbi:MAG: hypothetical protein IT368_03225 [Candidatus Hydrogenedentes bacterium]|nr:hypothetical protein [Candidatus Hydrogenedentota bacterium]
MTARLEIAPGEQEICARCEPDFSALLDSELEDFRKGEIEDHLGSASVHCKCLAALDQFKRAGERCRNAPTPELPEGFSRLVLVSARKRVRRQRLWRWLAPSLLAFLAPLLFVMVIAPSFGAPGPAPGAALVAGTHRLAPSERGQYRKAAGRVFVSRSQGWIELGYAGQPCNSITTGATVWPLLLEAHPDLAALAKMDFPVTFEIRGTWYRLDKE